MGFSKPMQVSRIVDVEIREVTRDILELVTVCEQGHRRDSTRYNNDEEGQAMAQAGALRRLGLTCAVCR